MELSAGDYWLGALASATTAAVIAWGAVRVRRRLVPEWSRFPARTAEATLATVAVLATAQLLALAHQLRSGTALPALVAAGLLMAWLGHGPVDRRARAPRGWSTIKVVTIAAVAAVFAQWSAVTAMAYRGGMTQPDTLWYHGPFTARFLQDRTLSDLDAVGYSAARFFPLDNELLHAVVAIPFRSLDLVSPIVNLGFLAMAIVAAAAIGERFGSAALGVLGALVGLSFPALVVVDAGAASSDLPTAAFLLAAVAMLLAAPDLEPAPLALAGAAAGCALGFKLTVAVPVAALTVGVLVLTWRRRQLTAALLWVAGLLVGAGAWFTRNLLLTGNPTPYFDLRLGPLHLEAAARQDGPPLLDSIFDSKSWPFYLRAFDGSIGRAWPLVLVGIALVCVVVVVRGPSTARVAAAAVLAAAAGHLVTPMTGGLSFENNLRYLHPALVLGGALVPIAVHRTRPVLAQVAAATTGALVAVNLASPDNAGFHRWPTEHRQLAVVVAVAVGLVGWWLAVRTPSRRGALAVPLALAAVLIVAGAATHRGYAERRYQEGPLLRVDLYRPFAEVRDRRVAVVGTQEVYPMFGPQLSNHVEQLTSSDRRDDLPACLAWRERLAGRFDLVAVIPEFATAMDMDPDELAGDPAAKLLVRNEHGAVYRIEGRIDTTRCRDGTEG